MPNSKKPTQKAKKTPVDISGLGDFADLGSFNISDLATNPSKNTKESTKDDSNTYAKVILIPIDKLHEDPNNARTVFEDIDELATSITSINPNTNKMRGVLNPIRVKDHPTLKGEYVICSGHRRTKAAQKVGLKEIPAIIDNSATDFDNFVENIHFKTLSSVEIANEIKKYADNGVSKKEIAERISRPASFVTDHLAFFELPECISDLFNNGYYTSIQGLSILNRAYKKNPDEVFDYCKSITGEITTSQIRTFCDSLNPKKTDKGNDELSTESDNEMGANVETKTTENTSNKEHEEYDVAKEAETLINTLPDTDDEEDLDQIKKPIIQVMNGNRLAGLMIYKRVANGLGWIKYNDTGEEELIDLHKLKLNSIVDGTNY